MNHVQLNKIWSQEGVFATCSKCNHNIWIPSPAVREAVWTAIMPELPRSSASARVQVAPECRRCKTLGLKSEAFIVRLRSPLKAETGFSTTRRPQALIRGSCGEGSQQGCLSKFKFMQDHASSIRGTTRCRGSSTSLPLRTTTS